MISWALWPGDAIFKALQMNCVCFEAVLNILIVWISDCLDHCWTHLKIPPFWTCLPTFYEPEQGIWSLLSVSPMQWVTVSVINEHIRHKASLRELWGAMSVQGISSVTLANFDPSDVPGKASASRNPSHLSFLVHEYFWVNLSFVTLCFSSCVVSVDQSSLKEKGTVNGNLLWKPSV